MSGQNDRSTASENPVLVMPIDDQSRNSESRFANRSDDDRALAREPDDFEKTEAASLDTHHGGNHRHPRGNDPLDDGAIQYHAYGITIWFSPPHAARVYLDDYPRQLLLNHGHAAQISQKDLDKIKRGCIEVDRFAGILKFPQLLDSSSDRGMRYWERVSSFVDAALTVEDVGLHLHKALTLRLRPPEPFMVRLGENVDRAMYQCDATRGHNRPDGAGCHSQWRQVAPLVGILHLSNLACGLPSLLQRVQTCLEAAMTVESKAKEALPDLSTASQMTPRERKVWPALSIKFGQQNRGMDLSSSMVWHGTNLDRHLESGHLVSRPLLPYWDGAEHRASELSVDLGINVTCPPSLTDMLHQ